MEWIKVPIDEILLSDKKDWQILSIIKYQALYSQLEIKPTLIQLKRILKPKELEFIQSYGEVCEEFIQKEIKSAEQKRKSSKNRYNKINDLTKILPTESKQTVASTAEQTRLEETRLEENNSNREKSKRFIPPTLEDLSSYCQARNNGIDAQRFIDFYSARGWMIGKNKMKDWRAAVRTWEGKNKQDNKNEEIVWTRPSDGWTFTAEEFKKQYGRNFGE